MRLCVKCLVAALALGAWVMPVLAQDERPGPPPSGPGAGAPGNPGAQGVEPGPPPRAPNNPPMSAEKAKVAWEWQAKGVSRELGLSDELTGKTVAAYVEARDSYRTATEKARKEMTDKARDAAENDNGADSPGDARRRAAEDMRKAMTELRKAEADKFAANIGKFLAADQSSKVMATLGLFEPSWDRMVHVVTEFKLEQSKTYDALKHIQSYIVASAKVRDAADPAGSRTAMREARDNLIDQMKKILNEQQMEQFQRTIAGGRGRGEGGPPGMGGRGEPGARGGAGAGGSGGEGGRGGNPGTP